MLLPLKEDYIEFWNNYQYDQNQNEIRVMKKCKSKKSRFNPLRCLNQTASTVCGGDLEDENVLMPDQVPTYNPSSTNYGMSVRRQRKCRDDYDEVSFVELPSYMYDHTMELPQPPLMRKRRAQQPGRPESDGQQHPTSEKKDDSIAKSMIPDLRDDPMTRLKDWSNPLYLGTTEPALSGCDVAERQSRYATSDAFRERAKATVNLKEYHDFLQPPPRESRLRLRQHSLPPPPQESIYAEVRKSSLPRVKQQFYPNVEVPAAGRLREETSSGYISMHRPNGDMSRPTSTTNPSQKDVPTSATGGKFLDRTYEELISNTTVLQARESRGELELTIQQASGSKSLLFTILRCHHLRHSDGSKCNSQVKVDVCLTTLDGGDDSYREKPVEKISSGQTKILYGTNNPCFNEIIEVNLPKDETSWHVNVSAWNSIPSKSCTELIGCFTLDLKRLVQKLSNKRIVQGRYSLVLNEMDTLLYNAMKSYGPDGLTDTSGVSASSVGLPVKCRGTVAGKSEIAVNAVSEDFTTYEVNLHNSGFGYGICLMPGCPPIVGMVYPNTPAAAAGIRPGDHIMEIGGMSLESLVGEAVQNCLNQRLGSQRIVVRRRKAAQMWRNQMEQCYLSQHPPTRVLPESGVLTPAGALPPASVQPPARFQPLPPAVPTSVQPSPKVLEGLIMDFPNHRAWQSYHQMKAMQDPSKTPAASMMASESYRQAVCCRLTRTGKSLRSALNDGFITPQRQKHPLRVSKKTLSLKRGLKKSPPAHESHQKHLYIPPMIQSLNIETTDDDYEDDLSLCSDKLSYSPEDYALCAAQNSAMQNSCESLYHTTASFSSAGNSPAQHPAPPSSPSTSMARITVPVDVTTPLELKEWKQLYEPLDMADITAGIRGDKIGINLWNARKNSVESNDSARIESDVSCGEDMDKFFSFNKSFESSDSAKPRSEFGSSDELELGNDAVWKNGLIESNRPQASVPLGDLKELADEVNANVPSAENINASPVTVDDALSETGAVNNMTIKELQIENGSRELLSIVKYHPQHTANEIPKSINGSAKKRGNNRKRIDTKAEESTEAKQKSSEQHTISGNEPDAISGNEPESKAENKNDVDLQGSLKMKTVFNSKASVKLNLESGVKNKINGGAETQEKADGEKKDEVINPTLDDQYMIRREPLDERLRQAVRIWEEEKKLKAKRREEAMKKKKENAKNDKKSIKNIMKKNVKMTKDEKKNMKKNVKMTKDEKKAAAKCHRVAIKLLEIDRKLTEETESLVYVQSPDVTILSSDNSWTDTEVEARTNFINTLYEAERVFHIKTSLALPLVVWPSKKYLSEKPFQTVFQNFQELAQLGESMLREMEDRLIPENVATFSPDVMCSVLDFYMAKLPEFIHGYQTYLGGLREGINLMLQLKSQFLPFYQLVKSHSKGQNETYDDYGEQAILIDDVLRYPRDHLLKLCQIYHNMLELTGPQYTQQIHYILKELNQLAVIAMEDPEKSWYALKESSVCQPSK